MKIPMEGIVEVLKLIGLFTSLGAGIVITHLFCPHNDEGEIVLDDSSITGLVCGLFTISITLTILVYVLRGFFGG